MDITPPKNRPVSAAKITRLAPALFLYSGAVMKRPLAILGLLVCAAALWAADTAHQVVLTWSAPASPADPIIGYDLYRTEGNSGPFEKVNASPLTATTYTDDTVQPGTVYIYYVVSVDAKGNRSRSSPTWSVTIPGHAPRDNRKWTLTVALLVVLAVGLVTLTVVGVYVARSRRRRAPAAR